MKDFWRETRAVVIPGILVGALLLWNYNDPTLRADGIEKWAVLTTFFGLLWIWSTRNLSKPLALFLSYFLVSSLLTAGMRNFHDSPREILSLTNTSSLEAAVCMFAFLIFARVREEWDLTYVLKWCGWLVLGAILCSKNPRVTVEALHNPSMAATLVVLATRLHPVASLLAIGFTHSWTAGIAFGVGFLIKYFPRTLKIRATFLGALGVLAILVVILLVDHPGVVHDNGRFAVWRIYWNWFREQSQLNQLIGMGAGTTRTWLPWAILKAQTVIGWTNVLLWAHNDFLQWLVEGGVIGATLGAVCVVYALLKSSSEDFPVLLAYLAAMMTNMVWHWPLTALVGWDLCHSIFTRKVGLQGATVVWPTDKDKERMDLFHGIDLSSMADQDPAPRPHPVIDTVDEPI